MPIYEYTCPKCGKKFEELVFGDKVPACPSCGNTDTKKLLSCATLHTAPAGGGYMPSSGGSSCGSCSGGNCSSCG